MYCDITSIPAMIKANKRTEKAKNSFRIMWTPRWTTDEKVGGSNFFLYYKLFLDFAKDNPDVDILIRPHQLMFNNFIKTRQMSKQEVDSYKN